MAIAPAVTSPSPSILPARCETRIFLPPFMLHGVLTVQLGSFIDWPAVVKATRTSARASATLPPPVDFWSPNLVNDIARLSSRLASPRQGSAFFVHSSI